MKVLITGTHQGIGAATAKLFLACGHEVHGIDKECAFEGLQDLPDGQSKRYFHYQTSVTGDEELLPKVDDFNIIITCAGVENETFAMDTNFYGVKRICDKYAFQEHIKAVVNVASVSAHTGAEYPIYCASKGAVLTYTKWLAQQLAQYGATANTISPGGVITPMNSHILGDPKKYKAVMKETLLNRWAEAKEIAQWLYFISVTNKSMTAQDIIIDNGEVAKYNFIQ